MSAAILLQIIQSCAAALAVAVTVIFIHVAYTTFIK